MTPAAAVPPRPARPWRSVLLPREHGGWSLALEPSVLGVAAVPSVAGGLLALSALAVFLARRPWRLWAGSPTPARDGRAGWVLALLALIGGAALAGAIPAAGTPWLPWLLPSVAAGGVFFAYDQRNAGRELPAEAAGAVAFSAVTGAIAAAGGAAPGAAGALAFAMVARALPTVLLVRAVVRGAKTGHRAPALPLTAATVAAAGAAVLVATGRAPAIVLAGLGLHGARAVVLLLPSVCVRARTLGLLELVLGAAYATAVGLSWPR